MGRRGFTPTTKHTKLKSFTFRTPTTNYNNLSKFTSRSRHIPQQCSLTQRPGHTICLNVLRLHLAHTVCKQLLLPYTAFVVTFCTACKICVFNNSS